DAAPKCISGRTSYHRVCLAFHPYPQVIPQVFNLGGFGPPRSLTFASACPWIDHSASGLQHATIRPIQTRFRSGSPSRVNLATYRNSPAHSSKGTPSRPIRRTVLTTLWLFVSQRFQVLFHSPPGVLFTFPSRYSCTIGRQLVLSLTRWSSQIHTGFPGSRVTREHRQEVVTFRVRGLYPLWRAFPERFH